MLCFFLSSLYDISSEAKIDACQRQLALPYHGCSPSSSCSLSRLLLTDIVYSMPFAILITCPSIFSHSTSSISHPDRSFLRGTHIKPVISHYSRGENPKTEKKVEETRKTKPIMNVQPPVKDQLIVLPNVKRNAADPPTDRKPSLVPGGQPHPVRSHVVAVSFTASV